MDELQRNRIKTVRALDDLLLFLGGTFCAAKAKIIELEAKTGIQETNRSRMYVSDVTKDQGHDPPLHTASSNLTALLGYDSDEQMKEQSTTYSIISDNQLRQEIMDTLLEEMPYTAILTINKKEGKANALTEFRTAQDKIFAKFYILPYVPEDAFVTICSFDDCRQIKIRENGSEQFVPREDFFEQNWAYLISRNSVHYTHTICPCCIKEHYPEYANDS